MIIILVCRSCKTNIASSADDEMVLGLFRTPGDQEDETEAVSEEDRMEPLVDQSGENEEDSETEADPDNDDTDVEIDAMVAMDTDEFFIAPAPQEEKNGQESDSDGEEFEFSDLGEDTDNSEQFSDPF